MFAAVAVLALAASPSPSSVPAPSPAPLKEIGRVRSRALCTALRENVAPTLAKLIEGDRRIASGRSTFGLMGRHQVLKDADRMEFDRIALGSAVVTLARSVGAAETLLSDKRRFPAHPATDDERDAAAMKAQLQAVVDEQKNALNILSGVLETDLLGQMQHEFPDAIAKATAPASSSPTPDPSDGVSYLDVAGIDNGTTTPADGGVDLRTTHRGLFGGTLYDNFAAELGTLQRKIATVEGLAADTVTIAVADCRRTPSPAPSASPQP